MGREKKQRRPVKKRYDGVKYGLRSTNAAADSVKGLADANDDLAKSTENAMQKSSSSVRSYSLSVDRSIEGINNKISSLKETIASLESIESYSVDTSRLTESIQRLEAEKFSTYLDNFLKNKGVGGGASVGEYQGVPTPQAQTPTAATAQKMTVNNYNYAVPVTANTISQQNRLTAQA